MPKKFKTKSSSWKRYHSRWKYYNNLQFKIANSLSSKHPFGRNPNTKKYYKSAQDFAKALSNAEKMTNHYKKLTKSAYKRQTGKSW